MKIEVNIGKKYFFGILGALLVLAGIIFVNAQDPNVFGHIAGEVGAGTFTGGTNDAWIFPGTVSIGTLGGAGTIGPSLELRTGSNYLLSLETGVPLNIIRFFAGGGETTAITASKVSGLDKFAINIGGLGRMPEIAIFRDKVKVSGELCINNICRSNWPSGGGSNVRVASGFLILNLQNGIVSTLDIGFQPDAVLVRAVDFNTGGPVRCGAEDSVSNGGLFLRPSNLNDWQKYRWMYKDGSVCPVTGSSLSVQVKFNSDNTLSFRRDYALGSGTETRVEYVVYKNG
ncbi:MAG: hypothetical protein IIA87_04775 [Nanoarchaeota archaeon]|nr:hypothetical protein [Nanoarchaeota archaeon]